MRHFNLIIMILTCCLIACNKEDRFGFTPEEDPEQISQSTKITAVLDSLSADGQPYWHFQAGQRITPGKYALSWVTSTDANGEGDKLDSLICVLPDSSFMVMNPDSLNIIPGVTIKMTSPHSLVKKNTTWSFDFTFSSDTDTLKSSLSYLMPFTYDFSLGDVLAYSPRYTVDESWEPYCCDEYFPFNITDSTMFIGMHQKNILMPDLYVPSYYGNSRFIVAASDSDKITVSRNKSFTLYDQYYNCLREVKAYSLTPIKTGKGQIDVIKGYNQFTTEYHIYEPMVLQMNVVNDCYLSASLMTASMDSGSIEVKCSLGISLIRDSDNQTVWSGNAELGTAKLDIGTPGINLYDKVINFSDEYILCKRKMYEYSAGTAVLNFRFSVNMPLKNCILKGYNLIGITQSEFVMEYDKNNLMEVNYE